MLSTAKDNGVSDQISKMQGEINSLTSQLAAFLEKEKKYAGGLASRVADSVNARVGDYSGQIHDLADSASEQIDGLQRYLAVEVKRHPLRTLAIAGAVGVLLGAFSRSR